jgi:hypothetical protein
LAELPIGQPAGFACAEGLANGTNEGRGGPSRKKGADRPGAGGVTICVGKSDGLRLSYAPDGFNADSRELVEDVDDKIDRSRPVPTTSANSASGRFVHEAQFSSIAAPSPCNTVEQL